jgi:hypothetical protein
MQLPEHPIRDGLGLVECCHRDDWHLASTLLRHADAQLTAIFLARLVADLLESWTDDPAEAFAWLREHHAGGA